MSAGNVGICQVLETLAHALEARDPSTGGHSRRVEQYALAIARAIRLDEESLFALEQAAILHDLGKIGVPDAVLQKNGSLSSEERRLMSQHPVIGGRILESLPFLKQAAQLARHHHEHYDGSGYPDKLAGSAIPLGARVLAVADSLDALTTDRPYHKAMGRAQAIQTIESEAGRLFDPEIVSILKEIDLDSPVRAICPLPSSMLSSGRDSMTVVEGKPS